MTAAETSAPDKQAGLDPTSTTTIGSENEEETKVDPVASEEQRQKQAAEQVLARQQQALAPYYEALDAVEQLDGPFHPLSSETLLSLGHALQHQGRHHEALRQLRRAKQVMRVNNGIHSVSQAPMLRAMTRSHKALAEYKETTSTYHQLLNLYLRSYGKQDPRLLPILNELSQWHLDAYQFDASDTRVDHLTTAHNFANAALQLATQDSGLDPATYTELLRGAALVNFFLSRHQSDEWSSVQTSFYSASADRFNNVLPARTTVLSGRSYKTGRKLHEHILRMSDGDSGLGPEARLRAQVELADWHLLFGHRKRAMELYKAAQQQISLTDQAEHWYQLYFAQPQMLPAKRLEGIDGGRPDLSLQVKADISAAGQASNARPLPDQPALKSDSLWYLTRDSIKNARFRPRFENGEPVESKDVALTIPLIR